MTWAFLRPHGAHNAAPFPSLQHVLGATARRRRTFPLEERTALALRLSALALALSGAWLSRGAQSGAVAVSESWPTVPDAALRLGFEGDTARAEGPGSALALETLRSCSDTRPACLLRAAATSPRERIVAANFGAGWERALRLHPGPFRFQRLQPEPRLQPEEAGATPSPQPRQQPKRSVRVEASGSSGAARLWTAALEEAGATSSATGAPIEVFSEPGPDVEASAPTGLVLPDPLNLAAGVSALPLDATLRFRHTRSALSRRGVAATEEELGRWAHEGLLLPLARAALGAPVHVTTAPPGGALTWSAGQPVGLADVPPGSYARADGRVLLELSRPQPDGAGPRHDEGRLLDDAALSALGGTPWTAHRAAPSAAALLFAAALAAFALATLPLRARRLPLQLATAALFGVLIADLARPHEAQLAWATNAPPPGAAVRAAPCEGCLLLAPWMLFDPARPRVDLIEVRAPAALPLGSSAELRVTVRVRRAQGKTVELIARPATAPEAREKLLIAAADEVREVRLRVSPLGAGPLPLAVEARVEGQPADDARTLSLQIAAQPRRRLVWAATPSWESRIAAEALDSLGGAPVQSAALLGAHAVSARGAPRLEGVDTAVLVGARELPGLRDFVLQGGAALLLGGGAAAAALGWPAPGPPQQSLPLLLTGSVAGHAKLSFRGYPADEARLPPGAEVLGRLNGKPWLVGRALGKGRVVVVEAPDLWRLSPPAGRGEQYRSVLAAALGWAEGSAGVAAEIEPEGLTTVPRTLKRAAAARARLPFFEADGPEELKAAWARLPQAPRGREPLPLRSDTLAFALLSALLALEALQHRAGASLEKSRSQGR